jgi:hypothetical protein
MKIAFHSHGLTLRGSEVALFDYALQNQRVLGNESLIMTADRPGLSEDPVFKLWREQVPVLTYRNRWELRDRLAEAGAEVLYQIKPGRDDGLTIPGVRNCVHALFTESEFHGDAYAYVSPWLGRVMTGRGDRFVPHLVPLLLSQENLRESLEIPKDARVFGRHGGWDTFNISFAKKVVAEHARNYPGDHFVFLNTKPIRGTERLANVHYHPATVDLQEKARFLATCDAMIHARDTGETFGLAVGEFAALGKPVITFEGSRERAHLEMLGDQAIRYRDRADLEKILASFLPRKLSGTVYEEFTDPRRVMGIFQEVFLS